MNLSAGYPFWLIKNGLPFDYPTVTKNMKTHVAVLGGGISGALVAWQLVQKGVHRILLDARSIGLGSTCASTSLLQYEIDTPLVELKDKVGLKNAVRCYQLCSLAIDELSAIAKKTGFSDFEYKQSLYYAAHKKDTNFLQSEYAIRKQNGFKVSMLNEQELFDTFSIKAPCAILSKQGAQTNAYSFTHRLLQHGIKKGLEVYDRTNITKIDHQHRGVLLTSEHGYTISAKKLIYATGYEVVKYISKPIVKLQSTYATISEHIPAGERFWKDGVLIWNTADPYLYMRTTPDNRILVGGRDEDFYNPAKRDKMIKRKAKQLTADFGKLFPHIPFKPEFNWTGTFGGTKDGLPYIGGYKPLSHAYFALGFGGNGITCSQVAANIISDMILGKKNKDAELFSFDRTT